VEEVVVDETAVTAMVVVAAVAAEDLRRQRGNLGYAVEQNWLGWVVEPNFVSCDGFGVQELDNPGLYSLEGGRRSDKDL
jgi:hypothetical protein